MKDDLNEQEPGRPVDAKPGRELHGRLNPQMMPLLKAAYGKAADAKDTAESQEAAAIIDKIMGIVEAEERRAAMGPSFETLDDEAAFLLSELRKVARHLQEFGVRIAENDYSDGINAGQAILDLVGACSKLADKFDEVGLYDSSKGEGFHV